MAEATTVKAKHAKLQAEYAKTKAEPGDKFPNLNKTLQKFVSKCVRSMLSELYEMIAKIEDELMCVTSIADQPYENREIIKTWVKTLYSDEAGNVYIVGPVGERPIHCCVFAIAKHRARQGEASERSEKEKYIADGILDGIKEYEQEREKNKNRSRLYEEYGRDYCAAVGCFLWDNSRETGKPLPDLKGLLPSSDLDYEPASVKVEDLWQFLPYIRQVIMWLRNHEKGNLETTSLGMYEGETPHFALIACCHVEAVKWFISVEEEEIKKSSPQMKRCGLLLKAQFIIDSILS
jgi:hypothetical protein